MRGRGGGSGRIQKHRVRGFARFRTSLPSDRPTSSDSLKLTRPLRDATDVVRRIAGGDLDARVLETGPPEVQELAEDMNLMTERLSDVLRANREFAANASHQLRTPLTALRLSLEEAVEGDDPRRDAWAALGEADRLALIVQSLLAMGGEREPLSEPIDVVEVARSVAEERPAGDVTVVVVGEGQAIAGRDRLEQVLNNLVDNSIRFARRQVRVEVIRSADRVVVHVDDDGPRVPVLADREGWSRSARWTLRANGYVIVADRRRWTRPMGVRDRVLPSEGRNPGGHGCGSHAGSPPCSRRLARADGHDRSWPGGG